MTARASRATRVRMSDEEVADFLADNLKVQVATHRPRRRART